MRKQANSAREGERGIFDVREMTAFAPYLNERFEIVPESAPLVEVELIEIHDLSHTRPAEPDILMPSGIRSDPFSLLFRSAPGMPLPQGMYVFQHHALGEFSVFITPVGGHDGGVFYEAIFN